jgi:hypothetical protein
MNEPLRARMTGRAFRFALMLRDFGHLDDAGLNQLLVTALEGAEPGEDPEIEVDLDAVRRVAARVLFERGGPEIGEGRGLLAEDWPLLFS